MRIPHSKYLTISLLIMVLGLMAPSNAAAQKTKYQIAMHVGEGHIIAAQWSADGSKIIVATDASVRIYSSELKLIDTLSGFFMWQRCDRCIDGNYLAYIAEDQHAVVLRNIQEDERTIAQQANRKYYNISFSPDGRMIALLSELDGKTTVSIWDIAANRFLPNYDALSVYTFSWTPDSRQILVCLRRASCNLVNLITGKTRELKRIRTNEAGSIVWRPDGKQVALHKDEIEIYDIESEELVKTLTVDSSYLQFSWSPDAKRFLVRNPGESLSVWGASTFEQIWTKNIRDEVAWSPNGDYLASVDVRMTEGYELANRIESEHILIGDSATGNEIKRIPLHTTMLHDHFNGWITMWSPNETRLLVAGTESGELLIYNVRTTNIEHSASIGIMRVSALSFSPDGKTIAVRDAHTGHIELWDVTEHRLRKTLVAGELQLTPSNYFDPEWSPDGKYILDTQFYYVDGKYLGYNSENSAVLIWDVKTGTYTKIPNRPDMPNRFANYNGDSAPRLASWQPNGQAFTMWDDESVLRLIEFPSGKILWTAKDVSDKFSWRSDGKALSVWNANGTLQLIDALSGRSVWTIEPYSAVAYEPCSVIWSPDSARFMCGAFADVFAIFDGKTGKKLVDLQEPNTEDFEGTWTPDGKRIFGFFWADGGGGSGATGLQVWDASTGKLLDYPVENCSLFEMTTDGNRMACLIEIPVNEMVVVDVATGEVLSDPLPTWDYHIVWNPNGKQIALYSISDMVVTIVEED